VSIGDRATATPAVGTAPRGPFAPAYRLISVALVALVTIVAFEFMAVATAMPQAAEELGAVRSYGLAFSVMLTAQLLGIVLAGVWSDRSGPMPGLYAGQLLFAAGAGTCGLASSFPVLLVGRAVTGLGAGIVLVVLYVVVGQVYPAGVRPRVFSFISAAWVLPSLVGAPLSGWLASAFSWRLVFWVVVPPALVTFAVVVRQSAAIRRQDDRAAHTSDERSLHRRTANLGVLVALAAALVQLGTHERFPVLSGQSLAAVVGVVGLLVVTPRLLPAGTLRMARGLPSVILSRFLLNGSFNGSITFIPLMLTQERGSTLSMAGAVLAVGSLGWSAGSWIQGLAAMAGRRPTLVSLGGLFLSFGCLAMVLVTAAGWPVWLFAPAMILTGTGMGLGSTSLSVLLLDLAPAGEYGKASAALQLSDVLGSVVGIAGASALFAWFHTSGGDTRTYLLIWGLLAGVAAPVVLAGRRCTVRS
jgi:MFS family permease